MLLETMFNAQSPKREGDKLDETWMAVSASWREFGQLFTCTAQSAAQMVLGIAIFGASSFYLDHAGRMAGQVIGILSLLLGGCGCWGGYGQKLHFQTLFIVGMGFMALFTFEFVNQVGRDMETHCIFAESHARITHLEDKVVALKHDEMISQLYLRINELDDLLEMVSSGTVDAVELRTEQKKLEVQDREYIDGKMKALQHHADEILAHVHEQAKQLGDEHGGGPQILEHQRGTRGVLQLQLNNINIVLDHLREVEMNGYKLSYEEYEMLIRVLSDGEKSSESLKSEEQHLPFVKAAMDRQSENAYHQYDMTNKVEELERILMRKAHARKNFERFFLHTAEKHPSTAHEHYAKSLVNALEDLPNHCLKEVSSYSFMKWSGWALIASQLIAAYVTTISVLVPREHDP